MDQPSDMSVYIQKLKQHSLRITLPRLQVLKILREADNAVTAFDIEHRSYAAGQHVNLSSVYSALKTFQDCGIVHAYKFENNKALFSLAQLYEPNRIECGKCGKVQWLKHDAMENMLREICLDQGFVLQNHFLAMNVHCIHCQP